MEMLYEKVLDDLLINQEKLTKTERVKVFVTLSNFNGSWKQYKTIPLWDGKTAQRIVKTLIQINA
jgi:hypothetical protein